MSAEDEWTELGKAKVERQLKMNQLDLANLHSNFLERLWNQALQIPIFPGGGGNQISPSPEPDTAASLWPKSGLR